MDKLALQLRSDADDINVAVSAELDARIHASLASVRQESQRMPAAGKRNVSFWWASSLSGVAATIAIIGIINLGEPEPEIAVTEPPPQSFDMPKFTWRPKAAILTETLEQELKDIESDLKKAERVIKEDLDNIGI